MSVIKAKNSGDGMTGRTSTSSPPARRLARLAAVQALYRVALAQQDAAQVIREFCEKPQTLLEDTRAGDDMSGADKELFGAVVAGVAKEAETLDGMIAGAAGEGITAARLEILLRAILRAGAWELHNCGATPAAIIINDYVDVAHAFFGAKEPGLVNAMLDRLAKSLR